MLIKLLVSSNKAAEMIDQNKNLTSVMNPTPFKFLSFHV